MILLKVTIQRDPIDPGWEPDSLSPGLTVITPDDTRVYMLTTYVHGDNQTYNLIDIKLGVTMFETDITATEMANYLNDNFLCGVTDPQLTVKRQ